MTPPLPAAKGRLVALCALADQILYLVCTLGWIVCMLDSKPTWALLFIAVQIELQLSWLRKERKPAEVS